jgi:hypothetical protein
VGRVAGRKGHIFQSRARSTAETSFSNFPFFLPITRDSMVMLQGAEVVVRRSGLGIASTRAQAGSRQHWRSCVATSPSQVSLGVCSHLLKANWQTSIASVNNIRHASTSSKPSDSPSNSVRAEGTSSSSILATYQAPLAKTFFRLKLFSLSSLTLATALSPVLMLAPAEIGYAGRLGLCVAALATSGSSTALLAWIGKPYVAEMKLLSGPASRAKLIRDLPEGDADLSKVALSGEERPAIQAYTLNWRLQKLQTIVYEPSLFRPTSRPFATWELPVTPPSISLQAQPGVNTVTRLVAATRNVKTDKIIGRWWARWTRDTLSKEGSEWRSDGLCTEEGKVIRHFSVHENLLDEDWQVL